MLAVSTFLAAMLFTGVKERFTTVLKYDNPTSDPIWYGGESRAEEAYASDYCVYLDIHYADGTSTWQKWAKWTGGTHGWEKTASVFIPKKPVKSIDVAAFLRHGTGKAEFRNVFVNREAPAKGTVLAVQRRTCLPFADEDDVWECVFDGKESVWSRRVERPSSLKNKGTLGKGEVKVWWADSMSIVTPLSSSPECAQMEPVRLDVARGEREGFQALVSTGVGRDLRGVEIVLGEFVNGAGRTFPGSVYWERQGYVPLPCEYHHHPDSRHGGEKWVPDPLLPAAPMHVRKGMTQGALVTFAAAREVASGTYRGVVRFVSNGRQVIGEIPVEVNVRDFSLPKVFGLKTGVAMMDGFLRKLYPDRFRTMKRQAWNIMLDHRLNPDDITRTAPPEIDDLLFARERGMNYFTVQNIVRPNPKSPWTLMSSVEELSSDSFYAWFTNSLAPYVAELRRHGLDKIAAVYGFDERTKEYYPTIAKLYPKLKRDLGIDLITSSMLYRDVVKGTLPSNSVEALSADIYVPSTQFWRDNVTEWFRGNRKQVWWYTCCGPLFPYPNISSLEYPPLEARVLVGWQTFAHRVDGYLYWAVNFWSKIGSALSEEDVFFDINTRSPFDMPGDGVMTYPGKEHILPGIRLASLRDAVEDYEWLQLAAAKDPVATAVAVRRVAKGHKEYVRDPRALRSARAELASIIEGATSR